MGGCPGFPSNSPFKLAPSGWLSLFPFKLAPSGWLSWFPCKLAPTGWLSWFSFNLAPTGWLSWFSFNLASTGWLSWFSFNLAPTGWLSWFSFNLAPTGWLSWFPFKQPRQTRIGHSRHPRGVAARRADDLQVSGTSGTHRGGACRDRTRSLGACSARARFARFGRLRSVAAGPRVVELQFSLTWEVRWTNLEPSIWTSHLE